MRYEVVKEYQDAPENPIKIETGERLHVIEESDPDGDWANWVYCKGADKEGWVPRQVLQLAGKEAVVTEDYCAKEHTLCVGERLIAEYELNGWIWCEKEAVPGSYAWAPLNHLAAR